MADPETPGTVDFSGMYRAHAGDVHRFAMFLSGDPTLADDIVSETFIRLWNARARVDLVTVRAYLSAIARNIFLQQRRNTRRTAVLDEEIVDPRPGLDQRIQARTELRAVLAALQALPEIDRAAVVMRTDGNMPYQEIAGTLGISVVAAKVKVHRARLKLAQARQPGGSGSMKGEKKR